jgi:hypothetical protein
MNVRRGPCAGAWILLAASAPALAHEIGRMSDPAAQFEMRIVQGLKSADANREDALFFETSVVAARSVFESAALWTKETLQACFWNGGAKAQDAVSKAATVWKGRSRIEVSFLAGGQPRRCAPGDGSDIRISLDNSDPGLVYEQGQDRNGNWSLLGRQATFTPQNGPSGSRYMVTVNLPTIPVDLLNGDWDSIQFLVSHEMGHALGLLHEFQLDRCKGWIDTKALASDQGWSEEVANTNLGALSDLSARYPGAKTAGAYDRDSVMQYNFAAKYFVIKPGQANPCMRSTFVTKPSAGDLATLIAMYGERPSILAANPPPPPTRIAATAVTRDLQAALKAASGMNGPMASAIDRTLKEVEALARFERGAPD